MRWEHREIRKYLDDIAEKLARNDYETEFEEMGLQGVLCPHNHKEEGILYPMMDQMFSELERARMFSEMNKKQMNWQDAQSRGSPGVPKFKIEI